jgi:hypothetical protein
MKFRIILLDGACLDLEPGDNFNFQAFIHGMRSMGFLISDQLYIRADMIKAVVQIDGPKAVVFTEAVPKGMMN